MPEHWVEVYVTVHRDRGEESTASDYCLWADRAETIARLVDELGPEEPPMGRNYPTARVRYLAVPPKMLRYLRPRDVVREEAKP
jgi:hypothetical protein